MFKPLTDTDLAKLHAKFVVPIVVDQMLRDEEPLDDIAEQAMNEILLELCPDTALLCIALCARHIAKATSHMPEGKALAIEAEKITEEYGPLWIAHENGAQALDPDIVRDVLSYIPEDFESLLELMENLLSALEEDHCIAAILCDILCAQIEVHTSEAEQQLLDLNVAPQLRAEPSPEPVYYTDNVVAFPVHERQLKSLS